MYQRETCVDTTCLHFSSGKWSESSFHYEKEEARLDTSGVLRGAALPPSAQKTLWMPSSASSSHVSGAGESVFSFKCAASAGILRKHHHHHHP